ncbi:hypothetical protein [Euzebya sp.]|uniref:hypothetical protein n=1 Tax=Euzebya sp. TaxID=1971409 RepID=UPI003513EDDD
MTRTVVALLAMGVALAAVAAVSPVGPPSKVAAVQWVALGPPRDDPPPGTPGGAATTATYPGRPDPGTLWWGAAVGGNADPATRHEQPTGLPLSLRRTFYRWDQRTSTLVPAVRADLSAGRLPWVSIKPPGWAEVADGLHDPAIDELLLELEATGGPVWLTVHHEPEGGGGVNAPDDPAGPAGHVAMNRHIRERMDLLGIQDVALVLILMDWTWDPRSGRDVEEWWEPGIYDVLGVDVYRDEPVSLVTDNWLEIRRWAGEQGIDVAVGEWGFRGMDATAGQHVREWYEHAAASHDDGLGARVVAMAAFDSGLNAPTGSWELRGAQLATFHELLADARTARL